MGYVRVDDAVSLGAGQSSTADAGMSRRVPSCAARCPGPASSSTTQSPSERNARSLAGSPDRASTSSMYPSLYPLVIQRALVIEPSRTARRKQCPEYTKTPRCDQLPTWEATSPL